MNLLRYSTPLPKSFLQMPFDFFIVYFKINTFMSLDHLDGVVRGDRLPMYTNFCCKILLQWQNPENNEKRLLKSSRAEFKGSLCRLWFNQRVQVSGHRQLFSLNPKRILKLLRCTCFPGCF